MASQGNEIRYRLTAPVNARRRRTPAGTEPQSQPVGPQLPRITRLMALAIQLDQVRREQGAFNYAELARLGHVSRSRVSQIFNLLWLAPDIQERLLFLEPVGKGREPVHEPALRPVTQQADWAEQRRTLERILSGTAAARTTGSRTGGKVGSRAPLKNYTATVGGQGPKRGAVEVEPAPTKPPPGSNPGEVAQGSGCRERVAVPNEYSPNERLEVSHEAET